MTLVHHLELKLEFPSGLSAGEGKRGNLLTIAEDGEGRPVLRGTAIAGALRAAFARRNGWEKYDARVGDWFGTAANDRDEDQRSRLHVGEMTLNAGAAGKAIRTHNAIDRHSGSVLHGGLFSIEALPPGTSGTVLLTLDDPKGEGKEFLCQLVGELAVGMQLGGRTARGLGRVVVKSAMHRAYDVTKLEDHAAFLDASWNHAVTGAELKGTTSEQQLVVSFKLAIPRGQDLCVGDGEGIDHTIEPQSVVDASGKKLWRLPGSSIRGVMRGWVTRLAARDGCKVADNVERADDRANDDERLRGDDLAWGFMQRDARVSLQRDPSAIECPVMRLFGSAYSKGRVHVSDATSTAGDAQSRKHVSIDRISGGASEGFLFSHQALTGGASFDCHMTIENPTEQEAKWLSKTLRALDMGLLRVGSSKSAGRLGLKESPLATGSFASCFTNIQPMGS